MKGQVGRCEERLGKFTTYANDGGPLVFSHKTTH